jgi:hypothetical protein
MASVWIRKRATATGVRYRVEYQLGGRESRARYGGSFKTMREATIRKNLIAGELAALRVPSLKWHAPALQPTFEQAAKNWQAARVDVAASTAMQHRIQLDKLTPLIGSRRIDDLDAQDFIDVVAHLNAKGVARETIRKTLGVGAMVLDHAGVVPNPARDRTIRLPRAEPEQISPPPASTSRLSTGCCRRSTGSRCSGSTGAAPGSRAST